MVGRGQEDRAKGVPGSSWLGIYEGEVRLFWGPPAVGLKTFSMTCSGALRPPEGISTPQSLHLAFLTPSPQYLPC